MTIYEYRGDVAYQQQPRGTSSVTVTVIVFKLCFCKKRKTVRWEESIYKRNKELCQMCWTVASCISIMYLVGILFFLVDNEGIYYFITLQCNYFIQVKVRHDLHPLK